MAKENIENNLIDSKLTKFIGKRRESTLFIMQNKKRLDEVYGSTIRDYIGEVVKKINNGFDNSIDVELSPVGNSPSMEKQFVRIPPKRGPLFLIDKTIATLKESQLDGQSSFELYFLPENEWVEKQSKMINNEELLANDLGLRIINALEEMVKAQKKAKNASKISQQSPK